MNLGWEAGLADDKEHLGAKILEFWFLLWHGTIFFDEKQLTWRFEPTKPSPDGVMPPMKFTFWGPLSNKEAMKW
jgi:hypothetical protein